MCVVYMLCVLCILCVMCVCCVCDVRVLCMCDVCDVWCVRVIVCVVCVSCRTWLAMNAVTPLSSHGVLETEVPQVFYLGFYLDCDADVLLMRLHACCSFFLLLLPSFLSSPFSSSSCSCSPCTVS